MSTKPYLPELGQAIFGNPSGEYECPAYVDALVAGILSDIDRCYWNMNQRKWDGYEDPGIPGIEFRPYYWGDDEAEAAKPNLSHAGVEVRWYKHPGRGTSLNVPADPHRMVEWYDSVQAAIWAVEAAALGIEEARRG